MTGRSRTYAAAVAVLVLGGVALPASARVAAPRANVTLQVLPRGQGQIRGGPEVGGQTCTTSSGSGSCAWSAAAGTRVTLTAIPAAGASVTWSISDCVAGATTCTFTLDADTTVVGIFGSLTLEVQTSGAGVNTGLVTSQPAGISCPGTCEARFSPGTAVTLTTTSKPGATFTSYPYGCETPAASPTCTVHVWDEPTSVGVKFNNAEGPVKPPVPTIKIRVVKAGNGTGDVSAANLTCGSTCTASFDYGTLVRFAAAATGGSAFGGWGGVCTPDRDLVCSLPAGPFTVLHPRFDARDEPPGAPGSLRATEATQTTITLVWSSATDDRGIASYEIYVGDEAYARESTTQRTVQLTGLDCGTRYTLAVVAVDTGGNRSTRATVDAATADCPLRIAKVGGTTTRTRMTCAFTASGAGAGTATLYVRNRKAAAKRVTFVAGRNTIAFSFPKSARGAPLRMTLRVGSNVWTWTARAKK